MPTPSAVTPLLACAPNFRDVGGLTAADGRTVRPKLLYRSEAVLTPSPADARCLADAGIMLVCDLRSSNERAHAPNAWWRDLGVELLEMDVTADIRASNSLFEIMRADPVGGGRSLMLSTYRMIPEAAGPHLALLFDRIAGGAAPLLIHCTAGKDRTGFVAALILLALGVPMDAVYEDYLASGARTNPAVIEATRRIMLDAMGENVSEHALGALTCVDRDYLHASFSAIDETHGSVHAYLEKVAGLDSGKLERVRARLLR